MTDEELDRLMIKLAEEYASEKEYDFLDYDEYDDITDYGSLKYAYINGFRHGLNFKEGIKMNINALDYYKGKIEEIAAKHEYFDSISIVYIDKNGNYYFKDLKWLFNEYPKQSYCFEHARDDVTLTEDGTAVHSLTLYIDEVE